MHQSLAVNNCSRRLMFEKVRVHQEHGTTMAVQILFPLYIFANHAFLIDWHVKLQNRTIHASSS